MRTIRARATCWWVARGLQRYLDRDPAAPLRDREAARLAEHLQQCSDCSRTEAEYRRLLGLLHELRARTEPDNDSVERIRVRVRTST